MLNVDFAFEFYAQVGLAKYTWAILKDKKKKKTKQSELLTK